MNFELFEFEFEHKLTLVRSLSSKVIDKQLILPIEYINKILKNI